MQVPKNGTPNGTRAKGHDPGLLEATKGDGPQGQGPGTPDRGPCALDLGALFIEWQIHWGRVLFSDRSDAVFCKLCNFISFERPYFKVR